MGLRRRTRAELIEVFKIMDYRLSDSVPTSNILHMITQGAIS